MSTSASPGPSSRRKSIGSDSGSASVTPRSQSPSTRSQSPAVRRASASVTPRSQSPASPAVRRSSLKAASQFPLSPPEEDSAATTTTISSGGKSPILRPHLSVSESLEKAVADLELELPTENVYGIGLAAPGYTVSSLAPPSIPVRSTSPSPIRPPPPTAVAFGRHHSPSPIRPPSPPPAARALPRVDGSPGCENGCGRAACFWCEKCEIEVCSFCDAIIHGKNTAIKRHMRVHLVDRLQVCEIHRETMRLFCSECSALVCQLCVATTSHKFPDGRGHPIYDVEEAARSKRTEISDLAKQLRQVVESAPRALEHLHRTEASVRQHISEVTNRLRTAVDDYEKRLMGELREYMDGDQVLLARHIDSTATVRRRLEIDADSAESLSSADTPAQTFLLHWRELRHQLLQDLTLKLGQPEPTVKMNVELTGQVQSGKVMTLEMEVQRVFDALNRCGRPTDVPQNAGKVVVHSPN